MGKENIFQVSHYNWGCVAYDPLEQQLLVEVPRALRKEYKVSGRLAPLEKLINERQRVVDVAGILSSPGFPHGTILSDLIKWVDPERKLGVHLENLNGRRRLKLAIQSLNHPDFQFFLEYYALSRYLSNTVSNNEDPVMVMEDGTNQRLRNLTNFATYEEEFAITFNFGIEDDIKACYIIAGALYEGEYDKDNLPDSVKEKLGDIDVVATLKNTKSFIYRPNLGEVRPVDKILKVLSRRIYHRARNGQSLSLKVNDEKVTFLNLDDFLYHEERGVIEFSAELEGSSSGPHYYMISGDILYEGRYFRKEEVERIGEVDIPDAAGVTEK